MLGAAKGRVEDLSPASEGLLDSVKEAMAQSCPEGLDVDALGWCRPKENGGWDSEQSADPFGGISSTHLDVSSRGARMGRTASFVTAVWCEMLRAYTVRRQTLR